MRVMYTGECSATAAAVPLGAVLIFRQTPEREGSVLLVRHLGTTWQQLGWLFSHTSRTAVAGVRMRGECVCVCVCSLSQYLRSHACAFKLRLKITIAEHAAPSSSANRHHRSSRQDRVAVRDARLRKIIYISVCVCARARVRELW